MTAKEEHVCNFGRSWPVGHPLPPVREEKLTGPEIGQLCIITGKYHTGSVVRVIERSYVWSPGECRSNGGYRHYDWSVITDDHGYQVVMNDTDLLPITTGMTLDIPLYDVPLSQLIDEAVEEDHAL